MYYWIVCDKSWDCGVVISMFLCVWTRVSSLLVSDPQSLEKLTLGLSRWIACQIGYAAATPAKCRPSSTEALPLGHWIGLKSNDSYHVNLDSWFGMRYDMMVSGTVWLTSKWVDSEMWKMHGKAPKTTWHESHIHQYTTCFGPSLAAYFSYVLNLIWLARLGFLQPCRASRN